MATFHGTAGNDNLVGTTGNDTFDMAQGGEDVATGLGGNDIFSLGQSLDAGDSIDGGAGINQLILRGDYSAGLTFGADTVLNIHRIVLGAGFSYDLVTADATVAAGQAMVVLGSKLGAADTLAFDGGAETDGTLDLIGGAGDDVLTGGQAGDNFNLSYGGDDTVHGGAGDDVIAMGAALDAGDAIDGGGGHNVLRLRGDYSAGLTLGAATIADIQVVQLNVGHSYNLTLDAANFAAGASILINAEALHAGNVFTFDAAASMADFHIIGGAANDVLTGGNASSIFDLSAGGNDTATGGNAHDIFKMGAALGANDKIDGGGGSDTVELDGDYSSRLAFKAATIGNVETLLLDAGHSYNLETNDANVTAGATLAVNGQNLGAGDALTFNGSHETDGAFSITGGAGNDVLTGGARDDVFNLASGGDDTAHGGNGDDTFNLGGAFTAADRIDGGDGSDTLSLNGDYSSGVTFGANTLTNVETITLGGGHSYNLTTNSTTVTSGHELTVDASALHGSDSLTFDASETDGYLTFNMGAALRASDQIDGGANDDGTVELDGDYTGAHALVFTPTTLVNILHLQLSGAHSYDITTNDGTLTAGQELSVDATQVAEGQTLTFNGSAETSGSFNFLFGDNYLASDQITGGGGNNYLELDGNYTGANAITFGAASLTSPHFFYVGLGDYTYDLTFDSSVVVNCGAGQYTLIGGAASSSFNFYGDEAFSASDTITGGSANDALQLIGDYSAGITFGATTMTNISSLYLGYGHSYNITTNDANVASGHSLYVNASLFDPGDSLTFDGSAETDGSFFIDSDASANALTGGAQSDTFLLDNLAGVFTVDGGGGDDLIVFENYNVTPTITPADRVDGGAGNDQLDLAGNYATGLVLGATTLTSVETLRLDDQEGDYSYNITTNDANVASGATLKVDASNVEGSDYLIFNGSAETDGSFNIIGGNGNDTLAGGAQADTFDGGAGADTLTGNGGADVFQYATVADSTSTGYDAITDFNASMDQIALASAGFSAVTGVDAAVTSGTLSTASFDSDLAAAVDSAHLAAGHAVLFTANAGSLSGHTFLVVDANGTAGYQAGADLVIDVTGMTGALTVSSFASF